jgi:hypothetical protein
LLRTLCAINTLLVTSMFMLAANPMACIIWQKHKSTQAIYIPLRLLTPEMNSLHQFPYSCPVRILLCEELSVQVSLKHSVRTRKTSNLWFRTIDIPLNSNAGSSMTAISLPRPWFQHRSVRSSKTKTFD